LILQLSARGERERQAIHDRNGDPPFRDMPKQRVGEMRRWFLEMFTEPLTEPPGKASRLPIMQR